MISDNSIMIFTTKEPKAKIKKSKSKLRYSIQYHEARKKHYDLRLEYDGVLLSFAIPKGPSLNPKDKRLAIQTENHPIDYYQFEGIIPKDQYGGGTVLLFDKGYWYPKDNVDKSLKKGVLKFEIKGIRINGLFSLIKLKDDDVSWLLIKEKDEFAKNNTGITKSIRSVKSNKTIKEIANKEKNPFTNPKVELALLKEEVPPSSEWIYEIKYDGYRIISEVENGSIKIKTRNHQDYTLKFPFIKKELEKLSMDNSFIIDGEIIYPDNIGRSSFQKLQDSIKQNDTSNVVYMVFDILSLNGEDLRDKTLLERRKILKSILKNKNSCIMFSPDLKGDGNKLLKKAEELSLEGIIAKRKKSLYTGKRSGEWIKIKCRKSDEFIIGGYVISSKKENNLKCLLLGKLIDNKLVYYGKVGTGFSLSKSKEIINLLKRIIIKKSPFENYSQSNVLYVKPTIICEVEYAEYTDNNVLRQASFKGIREDKNTSEIGFNDKTKDYDITSKDRIIFKNKNITKYDIASYYDQVAAYMLKYIKNRPTSVVRVNDDLNNSYFKKHPVNSKNGIATFKHKDNEYFAITSKEGILNEVQSGSIEFHIWGSKYNNIDKPDYMVFDLDPDENMEIEKIRKGVKDLKKVLESFNLKSFLKISGGKGYHIIVPFSYVKNWEVFEKFAYNIAYLMESKWPEKYTSKMSKKERKNKIFIDWMRNKKGATSIAPYSLRSREKATVSMPISWSELDKILPDGIDYFSSLNRLKKDPWKNFEKIKKIQKLK